LTGLIILSLVSTAISAENPLRLWYNQPAQKWVEALPVGNGRLGPMGAAWLCQHPYEHYLYNGDKKFLTERAYPLMKGAARFLLDFLVVVP